MKYEFSNNYVTDSWEFTEDSVRGDFIYNICQAFSGFEIARNVSVCIGNSLYARMNNSHLKYHNPIHILSTFQAMENENLVMMGEEHLAVWFHDAIYDPSAPPMRNEKSSAMFMASLMHGLIDRDFINKAIEIIHATGEHQKADVEEHCKKVMDLDMYGFTSYNIFQRNRKLIENEFLYSIDSNKFHKGSAIFMKSLIAKGFIFRTEAFKKYEEKAIGNANYAIKEHTSIVTT